MHGVAHNNNVPALSHMSHVCVRRVLRERGFSYAHPASADVRANHVLLQRLSLRTVELFLDVDGGQPEAQRVGEVMARAPGPVALDERRGSEVFQARARAGQRLTASFRASSGVLHTHNINL